MLLGVEAPTTSSSTSEEVRDLRSYVATARKRGAEMVLMPLGCSALSGRELEPSTWSTCIVGAVSSQIQEDSTLLADFEWASHLGLTAVLGDVTTLWPTDVSRALQSQRGVVPWRLLARCTLNEWKQWHTLRTQCDYPLGLVVALEINTTNPEGFKDEIRRWRAEPIFAIVLTPSAFLPNPAGFPVLPRATQSLLKSLQTLMTTGFRIFIMPDENNHSSDTSWPWIHLQYLTHFGSTLQQEQSTSQDRLEAPYRDVLQSPLQPLADHLDVSTYDIFEQDPFKYRQYQLAITAFLKDQASLRTVRILVVGAGRGPLVVASLAAADLLNISEIQVTALEKNPHALRALRHAWPQPSRVRIIAGDARRIDDAAVLEANGQLYDCVVSELLGSFGDNELSPECLLPISRWLRPGGVSIPRSYTSYLQPIACAKIWADARRTAVLGAPPGPPPSLVSPGAPPPARGLETPFVVKLNNFTPLSPPLPCFKFEHPDTSASFDRHVRLCFPSPQIDLVAHGLAGYFEATLYSNITISIHPDSHSPGMFSWFPIFFPFSSPVYLSGADSSSGNSVPTPSLVIDLARCSDYAGSPRIWYEWSVLEPTLLPIQNSNGRSSSMLLSS